MHVIFIPICDVMINNCDLIVSNLTEKIHKILINPEKSVSMVCGYLGGLLVVGEMVCLRYG